MEAVDMAHCCCIVRVAENISPRPLVPQYDRVELFKYDRVQ